MNYEEETNEYPFYEEPDTTKEAKPIIYEDFYGMTTPICPNCHELAYEETHCCFCGTPFLPPVKRLERKREVEGIDEEGKCLKCGKADKFKMVCHIDGTDFYSYEYECECGNHVSIKESREMFEVEDDGCNNKSCADLRRGKADT